MSCRRSGWTDTADSETSCEEGPGAVADEELIARLLHSGNSERPKERLKREELFPPKAKSGSPQRIKNVCGDPKGSDGASVLRSRAFSDDDLRSRSAGLAAEKEGREPRGAILGSAGAVRAIRSRVTPGRQVIFVYDDPTATDAEHCVIRCTSERRSEGDFLRTQVLDVLSRAVPQTEGLGSAKDQVT